MEQQKVIVGDDVRFDLVGAALLAACAIHAEKGGRCAAADHWAMALEAWADFWTGADDGERAEYVAHFTECLAMAEALL